MCSAFPLVSLVRGGSGSAKSSGRCLRHELRSRRDNNLTTNRTRPTHIRPWFMDTNSARMRKRSNPALSRPKTQPLATGGATSNRTRLTYSLAVCAGQSAFYAGGHAYYLVPHSCARDHPRSARRAGSAASKTRGHTGRDASTACIGARRCLHRHN
jgi:hypothetical protein